MEQEIRELVAKAARARQFADNIGSDQAAANLRSYAVDLEAQAAVLLTKIQNSPAPPTDVAGPEKPKNSSPASAN